MNSERVVETQGLCLKTSVAGLARCAAFGTGTVWVQKNWNHETKPFAMAASLLKLKSSVKSNEPAPVPKSSCRYQIVFALLKVVTRIDPNGGSWFPVFRFFPHSSECRAASSWTSPVLLLWSWLGMDENHPWWTPKWLAAVHLPQNNGPMGLALIHHHIKPEP